MGPRQYGIDQFGRLGPLIAAIEHQTTDGAALAHRKLPEAEQRHRAVATSPRQYLLFVHMPALLVDEGVVEADEDGLIAILFGVEHGLLPQAVVADQLAVDQGLADAELGLGLELVLDGGERHVAGIKQYQRLVEPPHQLAHLVDVAFEQGAFQHAGDLGMADQPLVARILVHAEKHHRGAEGGDLSGQVIDGIVVAEHHQIRLGLPVESERLLGNLVEVIGRATLGIHVEVADAVVAAQMGLQAGVVAPIPQVLGVIAADHQDLGPPQPQRQGTQQQ
ncbi:hypothetical protein D3C76_993250 [compost metagenome]